MNDERLTHCPHCNTPRVPNTWKFYCGSHYIYSQGFGEDIEQIDQCRLKVSNSEIKRLRFVITQLKFHLEQEEKTCIEVLEERDAYHEWADKLSSEVADLYGQDIGEHSNLNNPWKNALILLLEANLPTAIEAEKAMMGAEEVDISEERIEELATSIYKGEPYPAKQPTDNGNAGQVIQINKAEDHDRS